MMRTLKIALILIFLLNTLVFSQSNNTPVIPHMNSWAVGFQYSDNGFGVSGTYYKRLARTSDLMFKLSVSGVSDRSEVEYFDYYGNSYVKDKINRVYASTFSIGLKHNVFFDDIDGNFKPFIKGGVAPSLIITTPYDRSFFKAFGYAQSSFGLGLYGGVGIEYYESTSVGLSIGIEYSYIQVLGREVSSIKDKNITNIGGLQFSFNFMFL